MLDFCRRYDIPRQQKNRQEDHQNNTDEFLTGNA
jgi:hypothetical protein